MASKKIIVIITAALVMAAGGYYFFNLHTGNPNPSGTLLKNVVPPAIKKDSSIFDPLIPAAIGYVNDFGYYFTPKQTDTLTTIIQQFEKTTSNQIAIVTFNTVPVTNEDFDVFTKALANKWGVGVKGKNNGIVIAICKSMRKIRIQNGDGITTKLSDEATKAIIDNVIFPEFKKGDYYTGIKKGLQTIISALN